MPELHRRLAQLPAQQHGTSVELTRKIDQSNAPVLELDAQPLEFRLIAIDLACHHLDLPLQRDCSRVGKLRVRNGGEEIKLDDRFLPAPVLANDVLDDTAHQWQGAVRLIDGEELHSGNLMRRAGAERGHSPSASRHRTPRPH